MVKGQLSLLKWIFPSRRKESFVEVYVLRYNIPSEDGKFFVERTLKDGRKIRIRIVPSSIRNRVKQLRFRFYSILKAHRVIATEMGRIIEPEEIESLRTDLEEWKQEYIETQKLLDDFLANPWIYDDWINISRNIKKYGIKWPPKDLNITKNFYVEIDGPIKIPKKLYDQLILYALTNTNYEEDEQ